MQGQVDDLRQIEPVTVGKRNEPAGRAHPITRLDDQ
jgi:hypothetical protein